MKQARAARTDRAPAERHGSEDRQPLWSGGLFLPEPDVPLSIGFVVYPGLSQLALTGPLQVFAGLPDTTCHIAAKTMALVASDSILSIPPTTTFADCPDLDLICVPGGPRGCGRAVRFRDDGLRQGARTIGQVGDVSLHRSVRARCGRFPERQARHDALGLSRSASACRRHGRRRTGNARRQCLDLRRRDRRHRFRAVPLLPRSQAPAPPSRSSWRWNTIRRRPSMQAAPSSRPNR